MNRKHMSIIIILLLNHAAYSMQSRSAEGLWQSGIKVAKGASLVGAGIAVSCLSKPISNFLAEHKQGEYGQPERANLNRKCVKDCFAWLAHTSMVSSGLYSSFIGALMLTSRYDVNSVAQVAKLTSCLPLFATGMSTLNSTRLLLQRWCSRNADNGELVELSLSAGVFGAVAAVCLHTRYRLFPFKSHS